MDISLGRKTAQNSVQVGVNEGDFGGGNDISLQSASKSRVPTRTAPSVAFDDLDAFINVDKKRPGTGPTTSTGPSRPSGSSDAPPDFGEDGPDDFAGAYDEDGFDDGFDEVDQASELSDGFAAPAGPKPSEGYVNIEDEKTDLLCKIGRFESRGMAVKNLDMRASIEDIRVEHKRLKREIEVQSSLRFSRQALMTIVTGIEYANNRWDPFHVHLDGWSENTYQNIEDYDNVFEKLHDKYASYIQVAPELELLMTVAGSAFMFHVTHSWFKTPNAQANVAANPEVMKSIFKMMSQNGGGNAPQAPTNAPTQGAPPAPGGARAAQSPFDAPPRDMSGPSMDLSGFPVMPSMSGAPVENPKQKLASLRETYMPDASSQPPPKPEETKKQEGLFEDDLADLDSLAGSDPESDAPPAPSKPTPPAPKKRGRPKKTYQADENAIEI